jgi:8-oxo-dGTP diphosphatase
MAPMSEDRVRVAAYAVVRDPQDRVLLCHIHPSVGVGDIWTLPGGGLEFGEAPARAAVRELLEETGFIGEVERLVEVDDRLFSSGDGGDRMHAIRIVYEVHIVGGALRDEPDGSTDTCRWVTPEEALRMRLGELARHAVERLTAVDA